MAKRNVAASWTRVTLRATHSALAFSTANVRQVTELPQPVARTQPYVGPGQPALWPSSNDSYSTCNDVRCQAFLNNEGRLTTLQHDPAACTVDRFADTIRAARERLRLRSATLEAGEAPQREERRRRPRPPSALAWQRPNQDHSESHEVC